MPGRGKLVIAVMLLLGLALGGYAWWVQFQKGQRTLQFWGARPTYLIRHADRVHLLRLTPAPESDDPEPDPGKPSAREENSGKENRGEENFGEPDGDSPPGGETLEIAGRSYAVAAARDISDVRGLVHARHTLVVDAFYRWGENDASCQPRWQFALRFVEQKTGDRTTLVFAPNCRRVRLLEREREVSLLPGLSDALQDRSSRWFQEGRPLQPAATRGAGRE